MKKWQAFLNWIKSFKFKHLSISDFKWWWAFPIVLVLWVFVATTSHVLSEKVDYSTEIKPILNRRCIACHGGVKQNGDWSILFREEALGKTKSGKYAIIPGDASGSEMIRRIKSHNIEERMPLDKEPLTDAEIDLLARWIDQGAEWGEHWAYQSVNNPEVPRNNGLWHTISSWFSSDGNANWAKRDMDYFVLDKLKDEKLNPSPQAAKSTLLRRASLDIVGMPPSQNVIDHYFKDNSPKAYDTLVDSLLKSKHFGEKWAALWMDLARYADTKGYERDDARSIWRYRDWLIKAFNNDMPYNEFITKQLAGDLLPNPSDEDYVATAFHRNTMTNDEGGTDNEEFRTAAVIDRVNTTWETLNGTTFACVQCHSHPYDPFKHDEYYKFMAYFNNTRDEDTHGDYPLLYSYKEKADSLKIHEIRDWVTKYASLKRGKEIELFLKTRQPSINSLNAEQFTNGELADTKWLSLRSNGKARIRNVTLTGKTKLIYRVKAYQPNTTIKIRLGSHQGQLLTEFKLPDPKENWTFKEVDIMPNNGTHDLYFECLNPAFNSKPDDGLQLFDIFYFTEAFPGEGKPQYAEMKDAFWELLLEKPLRSVTPIVLDNPPEMKRKTHVFERGNWMVKGKEVSTGTPHIFPSFPKNEAQNRLGLARWMTSSQHPLTARVMVNRVWEQLFGVGLVETLEDFGTQGFTPTHPELLDHLAYKFMHEYKWSVKKLIKEIVMSATYQQSSKASTELLAKDPQNKLLARFPRVRLSAEQVRDQALAISGVWSPKMYGKSVMPFQPKGIWESPWNGATWVTSEGKDQYRRMLYTYWKRTSGYPSMLTFDGASREVCTSRRIRTNTPLQALVTLNDSTFIDMSRYFAHRMMRDTGNSADVQTLIRKGYALAMQKTISAPKLATLKRLYETALLHYKASPEQIKAFLALNPPPKQEETKLATPKLYAQNPVPPKPPETPKPKFAETSEMAALTVVANAILNLDEVVNKE